jgi:hypothetical protein
MIRAQVTLTPTESKKLLAKAVLEMGGVKKALKDGIVVIHPSSSTYFIRESLIGPSNDAIWLIGMIAPRGTCIEAKTQQAFEEDRYQELTDPGNFPFSWVLKNGKPQEGLKLSDILDEMGSGDVYIKGVNAFDSHGYVGVLMASLAGGTIGRALAAQRKKGFHMVYLTGLEKFVPSTIREVAKETGRNRIQDALGIPCHLLPIRGQPVTDIEAFDILTGATAIPVAAGGVGGAEGSITMIVKGEEREVRAAMAAVKEIKGAQLPKVKLPDCSTCHFPGCHFSVKETDW